MLNRSQCSELPYVAEGSELFDAVAHWPWSVFLDSGPAQRRRGRHDIIAANPSTVLVTRGGLTEVRRGRECLMSQEDPLKLLARMLGPAVASPDFLPLDNGALGYFAYDLAQRLNNRESSPADQNGFPEMAVGIYDWVVVIDHQEQRTWLASHGRTPDIISLWPELVELFSRPPRIKKRPGLRLQSGISTNMDVEAFASRFCRVKDYLRSGDCDWVNLVRRFSVAASGDPWTSYKELRLLSPTPLGAFLQLPHSAILCNSSERIMQVRDKRVMLPAVDGVPAQFPDRELDEYLKAGLSALDVLRTCFPDHTMIGTPTTRAMEIIAELEPNRRGGYAGAIGYAAGNGDLDMNIATQTLVHFDRALRFWGGAPIVAGSSLEETFQHTTKSAYSVLNLLATNPGSRAHH